MVDASQIRDGMEVLGSDGGLVGIVDHVEPTRLKLTRKDAPDGQHHYLPLSSVARIDRHVHLGITAAAALAGAVGVGVGHDPFPPVEGRAVGGPAPRGWLPWVIGAIGLLLLFLLFRSCAHHDAAPAPVAPAALPVEAVKLPNGQTVSLAPDTLNYELQRFLASADPAPRTFTFDKLNFDTGSAAIRADDQPTIDALAQILAAYPKARVKVIGYTDARGAPPANDTLGQERAASVAAALAAKGVDKAWMQAASGGETNPRDTNATAQGRFENRRTELEVVAK